LEEAVITEKMVQQVQAKAAAYWRSEIKKEYIQEIAKGKEIGHRIADIVEEKTTALLEVNYECAFERDGTGKKLTRSMGDIWLRSNAIYNPVNVKSGLVGSNGQPNLVAMGRLLTELLNWRVDSYYLLIVKLKVTDGLSCEVHFVDMLDHLDCVTFDSGPGQIMLKERTFYDTLANVAGKEPLPLETKVGKLVDLLEDGEKRLFANRKKRLARVHTLYERYRKSPAQVVDQSGLNLQ
jgi:hypothetical protein